MTGNDEQQRWPCRSSHRITVSLDGVKPLTVTLPYPILSGTIKATLRRKDRIVEVVAAKALKDLWPEDVIRYQFRCNAKNSEQCTDEELIFRHLRAQFRISTLSTKYKKSQMDDDVVTRIRVLINTIFKSAVMEKEPLIALHFGELSSKTTEWLIRAHLPVRISPRGSPVLLLSALDKRHMDRSKLDSNFMRILCDSDLESKTFVAFIMKTEEEVQLFRYVLRINSTKIQPNSWQKKKLPRGGDSPWLATFIGPIYLDGAFLDEEYNALRSDGSCRECGKLTAQMKQCSRCKSTPYFSVECQRKDWPLHKLSCSKV